MSPIAMRPSSLGPVKRKVDTDDNYANMYSPPSKRKLPSETYVPIYLFMKNAYDNNIKCNSCFFFCSTEDFHHAHRHYYRFAQVPIHLMIGRHRNSTFRNCIQIILLVYLHHQQQHHHPVSKAH